MDHLAAIFVKVAKAEGVSSQQGWLLMKALVLCIMLCRCALFLLCFLLILPCFTHVLVIMLCRGALLFVVLPADPTLLHPCAMYYAL